MLAATSGVVRAAMAASSTSSVERLAGRGCIFTWMSGLAAFQESTTCVAKSISWGFDDGQKVIVVWAKAVAVNVTAASAAHTTRQPRRGAGGCAGVERAGVGRATPGCLRRARRRRARHRRTRQRHDVVGESY